MGLEEPAHSILEDKNVNLFEYVTTDKKELSTIEDVEKGIVHIFASIIATDTDILTDMREWYLIFVFLLIIYLLMLLGVKRLILKLKQKRWYQKRRQKK